MKRSSASLYARCRRSGLIALGMREDDELIAVREIGEDDHIVLATANGMAIRFSATDVRPMGRSAAGVKGVGLRRGDTVVASLTLRPEDQSTEIMAVSALGYGKRTRVDLYRLQSRGGIGLINFKVSSKTGALSEPCPLRIPTPYSADVYQQDHSLECGRSKICGACHHGRASGTA